MTITLRLLSLLVFALPAPLLAQQSCPTSADPETDAGWTAYRAGDLTTAEARFGGALARCADHVGAETGLGYVDMRAGRDSTAARRFASVLRRAPTTVDAAVGLGLIAWRAGDLPQVRAQFERVLALDPQNADAREYLARLEPGVGPGPERPALALPDTVTLVARTAGSGFEVRAGDGWRPFWVKGVNLGAALPGKFPSEFPDSAVYAGWLEGIAGMGANVVRLYTIHPPAFYSALAAHNRAHPDHPLWIIHGVWTELPADDDFAGAEFQGGFFDEMERVVDVIHGRADLPPNPGHASGFYTADVSSWTLAYVIGREWEPHAVVAFDAKHANRSFRGRYVEVSGGNAMDAWLGEAVDHIVALESQRYRTQRPVAYTNWPTLDPLVHPTESTADEEVALRRARGEQVETAPLEYDNDAVSLDATLLHPTAAFPAGTFASYHAYPYYPDFMSLQESYQDARSSLGRSRYFGYLQELIAHHRGMPVLIAEYGVPASLGIAHLQPDGWHHGGHDEADMAAIDRRMTLEIAESGAAGAVVFAWIDEWFKKNWLTIDFELPEDRNRLWLNRLDAEQQYGMLAIEAEPPVRGATVVQRRSAWAALPAVLDGGGGRVRAAADAAYLWLQIETPGRKPGEKVVVGLDVVDPRAGDRRLPGATGPQLPVGIEFALVDDGAGVRLLVDPPQNPFRLEPFTSNGPEPRVPAVGAPPPGLFAARAEQRFNRPYRSVANADGVFDSMRVLPNRRRLARDGTEFLGVGYDRGVLREGEPPDGSWQRDGDVLEVRIPWGLLNVTDPSSHAVLQGVGPGGEFHTVAVPDIGLVALRSDAPDHWTALGASEASGGVPVGRFRWPGWETPSWRARERPALAAMREAFGAIADRPVRPKHSAAAAPRASLDEPSSETVVADVLPEPPPTLASAPDSADAAWIDGRTAEAERLYHARLARDPTDRVALERLALLAAWAGRYGGALALYDRLLAADPGDPGVRSARARVLEWKDDLDAAHAVYDSLVAADPDDLDARLDRARVLALGGRLDEARAAYRGILDDHPDLPAAWEGMGRTESWADDLPAAERSYRRAVELDSASTASRVGLAQVHAWQGHNGLALAELEDAVRRSPADPAAREQLARQRAAVAPAIGVAVALETDSDGNRMLTSNLSSVLHPWSGVDVRAAAYGRSLEQGSLARGAWGGRIGVDWQVRDGWTLSADAGQSRNDGDGRPSAGGWSVASAARLARPWLARFRVSREALDQTARLTDVGVRVTAVDLGLRWTPTMRWLAEGAGGWARFQGTEPNRRLSASGSFRRTLTRGWSVGAGVRTFGFERDLGDGYFDPRRFVIAEAPARWETTHGPFTLGAEVAPGVQSISPGSRAGALRGGGSAGWSPGPGRALALTVARSWGGFQSFAGGASTYRYSSVGMSGTWSLARGR